MHTSRFFAFNLIGHVLPMAVALISVPVIVHYAGVERLGALGVVWALVGYFSFLDFGLSRVVTRRVAQAAEQQRLKQELTELRGFLWWWALPALLLMAWLLLAMRELFADVLPSGELGREIDAGWRWIAWGVPVTLATNWLRGALEGVHRFARVNLLRIVFGAWTYGAPAVAAMIQPTLGSMIAAIVIGRILALLAHVAACVRAEPAILFGPAPRRLASMRLFFQEGGWITISNVISPLMVYSDRFVLAVLLPPRAVAWYVTSQEVMLRMLVIPGALAGVLFPRFAGGPEKTATMPLATIYQRGIRAVGAMMLPLCILAATGAYDGIRVWLGDEFALNSYRVVAIVAVGVYANAIAHLPFAWLQASGRADLTATMHLIELPLYAAGLIACAIQWGIIGAAAVWAVRVSIDCVVLLWLAQRDGISAILVRLLGGMGLIAIAAIVADPHWHWQWRLALSTSFMLIGVYTAWMHVLRMEDRLQLRNLIRVA